MDEEELCEQCGREPASETVDRAGRSVRLCGRCLEAEDRTPPAPIAAAWAFSEEGVAIERVWPVPVNLHSYHLERVLEQGIEVPGKLKARAARDEEDEG